MHKLPAVESYGTVAYLTKWLYTRLGNGQNPERKGIRNLCVVVRPLEKLHSIDLRKLAYLSNEAHDIKRSRPDETRL